MAFKVVFIASVPVDGGRVGGWETIVHSDAPSLQAVSEDALRMGKLLNNMTAQQVRFGAARISDLDTYRLAATVYLPASTNSGSDCDFPTTAIHTTQFGVQLQPVPLWVRGMSDAVVSAAILDLGVLKGIRPWGQFLQELSNENGGSWCIRRIPSNIPRIPILAINGLLTITPTLALAQPYAWSVGNLVRVQLVKGAPLLKRVWKVTSVSPDLLTIGIGPLAFPLYTVPPQITNLGAVRDTSPDVYATELITKVVPDYATKKNVGRPPLVLTGRRKAPK
jgi:hypothetical protein